MSFNCKKTEKKNICTKNKFYIYIGGQRTSKTFDMISHIMHTDPLLKAVSYTHLTLPTICSV